MQNPFHTCDMYWTTLVGHNSRKRIFAVWLGVFGVQSEAGKGLWANDEGYGFGTD